MIRRWRLYLFGGLFFAVAVTAYVWIFHGRFQYEPLCWHSGKSFHGPLDAEYMSLFIEVLHELRGGPGLAWDGELVIRDRRIYFNRFRIDYDLPLNAALRALKSLVERKIDRGVRVPEFALSWREIERLPLQERVAADGRDELFCKTLQWVALDRSHSDAAADRH